MFSEAPVYLPPQPESTNMLSQVWGRGAGRHPFLPEPRQSPCFPPDAHRGRGPQPHAPRRVGPRGSPAASARGRNSPLLGQMTLTTSVPVHCLTIGTQSCTPVFQKHLILSRLFQEELAFLADSPSSDRAHWLDSPPKIIPRAGDGQGSVPREVDTGPSRRRAAGDRG